MKGLLVVALLSVGLACEKPAPQLIFAPTEVGLTVAYEDPSLPEAQRFRERLQVRVASVKEADQKRWVTKTFTTQQGELDVLFTYFDGGVSAMKDPTTPSLEILPRGFPNVRPWEERGRRFRVTGRAALTESGLRLPDTVDRVGVWVDSESVDGKGPKLRSFYLPRLGEIETQELKDGKWVAINRMVSYGFVDAPMKRN